MEWVVPYSHVVDKNWEAYLRNEGCQPHIRLHSPGFQCQEDKSPQLLPVTTTGVGAAEETVGFPGGSSWRTHIGLSNYTDSLPLGSSTREAAGRALAVYWEALKYLASG